MPVPSGCAQMRNIFVRRQSGYGRSLIHFHVPCPVCVWICFSWLVHIPCHLPHVIVNKQQACTRASLPEVVGLRFDRAASNFLHADISTLGFPVSWHPIQDGTPVALHVMSREIHNHDANRGMGSGGGSSKGFDGNETVVSQCP